MNGRGVLGSIVGMASLIVIIAGFKAAASLLVPFILSLFITLLLFPALKWLIAKGVPVPLAFALVILAILALFVGLTGLVSTHVADLFAHAQSWQANITDNLKRWIEYLGSHGFHIDQKLFFSIVQPDKIFVYTLSLLKNTSMLLSNSLLIFFTVVFMLTEAFIIKEKVRYIEKMTASEGLSRRLDLFSDRLNRYFSLKAFTSAVTGAWIFAVLYAFDIPYPLLWALGGFLLNFIPVIGSIIAAIPPILLALATHGFSDALWIAGWFLVINIVIGNILEPRIMGRGLELSELVVFLSLVFWGWVFGKVGMLLAVPLTMIVKFALETADSTRWIAVMLSSRVPKD